jgi:transcription antitermination factor NusG
MDVCSTVTHRFGNRERRWYAVFTAPRSEKAIEKHLNLCEIECFLPTYETYRVWKNRQRVKVVLPLFPAYLFVCIDRKERARVLQSPGVLHIVGNSREPLPLPDSEIDFLRSDFCRQKAEPYRELLIGQKVRIARGIMRGVEGVLVRKNNSLRFVMRLSLINQNAAVEVCSEDLETLCA